MALYIVLGVIAVLALWLISVFNSLVRSRNRVREAWSDINVQLRRRHDLIPNLVETVKGYAAHEKEVLENVVHARTEAVTAGGMEQKAQAENMLTGALKSLFALSEAYPNLKANENFAKLQDELSDTENKIQAARRFYNTNVMDYNTKVEVFPNNIIAGFFGGKFTKKEFFEIEEAGQRENVAVKF